MEKTSSKNTIKLNHTCLIGTPIMDYSAIVPAKQEGYIAAWCSRVSRVFDPKGVAKISKFCFSTMHLLIARMSQKVSK